MPNLVPSIIAMLFCIVMSAYFSATEAAFSSLNKTRIKVLAENGDPPGRSLPIACPKTTTD